MKLNSKVYRKAANILMDKKHGFACVAIAEVCGRDEDNMQLHKFILERWFKYNDRDNFFSMTKDGKDDEQFMSFTELGRLRRAIALDLLAEMIENGEKL